MRLTKGSTTFDYEGDRLLSESRNGNEIRYVYGASGVIGFKYNGANYYYVRNLQGDVTRIVDTNNQIFAQYTYDAWGNCTIVSETNGIGTLNAIRYRGYYFDSETGLYYLQTRYYDPEIGRFISPDNTKYLDPESLGGLNLYAYCNNNPVIYADPSGNAWETVFDIISLATSIIEVAINPADPSAWVGLVVDIIDVAVPFVAGVGETVRAINTGRRITDAADDLHDAHKIAKNIHGNSLRSNRYNYGYQLLDKNGNVLKYGESKNPYKRYSNKYLIEHDYRIQIKVAGTKRGVHDWQHDMIENYAIICGRKPELNLSLW